MTAKKLTIGWEEFLKAQDLADRSKLIMEDLAADLQNRMDQLPANVANGENYAKVWDAINALEDMALTLDEVSGRVVELFER